MAKQPGFSETLHGIGTNDLAYAGGSGSWGYGDRRAMASVVSSIMIMSFHVSIYCRFND